jgi:hypothetical protein
MTRFRDQQARAGLFQLKVLPMQLFTSFFLGLAFLPAQTAQQQPAQQPTQQLTQQAEHELFGEAKNTKILYAGSPGGSREKAFTEFLKQWFDKVDTLDLRKLNSSSAEPYDVVIADWTSRYGNDGYKKDMNGPSIQLGPKFKKPIVMIGAVGGEIAKHSLLDWL